MWWFLLLCGLLYGACCFVWDLAVEYWWLTIIILVVMLLAHKEKREKKKLETRENMMREIEEQEARRALAELESAIPVDPLFTSMGAPIRNTQSEEAAYNALCEINLLMWAARAVSEYNTIDDLRNPVKDAALKRDQRCKYADDTAVTAAIYRTCRIEREQALDMVPKLVELKFLIRNKYEVGYTARMTANEFDRFYKRHEDNLRLAQGLEPLHRSEDAFVTLAGNTASMDYLSGEQFEEYCTKLLDKDGFSNIRMTKRSGDHGVDILAEKDGILYAIQCKCYSSTVGNAAVQQVYSGKDLYDADVAVVMTNNYFSKQAIEDAKQHRVRLWDRDKLLEMQ